MRQRQQDKTRSPQVVLSLLHNSSMPVLTIKLFVIFLSILLLSTLLIGQASCSSDETCTASTSAIKMTKNEKKRRNDIGQQTTTKRTKVEDEIKYDVVEEIESKHVRLAAFHRTIQNDSKDSDEEEWKPLSISQWATFLSSSSTYYTNQLTETINQHSSSYNAYFFETKGVSSMNDASQKQFEFVLINSDSLHQFSANNPDINAFAQHLDCLPSQSTCCSFSNLSGDATLVVPKQVPPSNTMTYANISPFLRKASKHEIDEIWKRVAMECIKTFEALSDGKSVWLSTSGMGIAWLHFRLDSRPKYYTYKPFKRIH